MQLMAGGNAGCNMLCYLIHKITSHAVFSFKHATTKADKNQKQPKLYSWQLTEWEQNHIFEEKLPSVWFSC